MVDDAGQEAYDERETELSTLSAIFPELLIDIGDPFSASIDLAVVPSSQISVVFPESSDGAPFSANPTEPQRPAAIQLESHVLSYLPSIHVHITLPSGYPAETPPVFELSTSPPWLPSEVIARLKSDGERLWNEFGHDQVVYAYIDHLQQSAETAFGVTDDNEHLQIPQDYKISILDYDIQAKKAAFEKETFDCGVCLGEHHLGLIGCPNSNSIHNRSEKGCSMPQAARLWSCFLSPVPAGLLQ